MNESNAVIIRKTYEDVAHRYIPAALGVFDASSHLAKLPVAVRSRATLQAMTRS